MDPQSEAPPDGEELDVPSADEQAEIAEPAPSPPPPRPSKDGRLEAGPRGGWA